ncbi:MAG TPA: hypothetical protein VMG10_03240 [Gemmataceae bacterium]|nr:hypothetical protein [Gemmataceae bacterium]
MAMVCPQCNTPYEQRLQCPLCGTRLLFHDARRLQERSPERPLRWRQRPWGRIFVGLLLAQGLFYGLRHLLTAVLMVVQGGEAVEQMWTLATGILLLQGVRMFSVLIGGVFAGAGQQQAAFLGAMVGAWNGVFSVLLLPGPAQALTPITVLGQPLLQAGIGAVSGWLGSAFWTPLPSTTVAETPLPRKRSFLRRNMNLFTGPIAWVRVSFGVILAVTGSLTATLFFETILDISHGVLTTTDDLQDRLIVLEIKAFALILGGILAGASTSNGLKQGLCVGLASTVILIGIEMNFVERWVQLAGLTAVAAFSLSVVGGWFGSQLFPPVIKARRQRGLGRAPI